MAIKGKKLYIMVTLAVLALTLSFRPGLWLLHKPASTQNVQYVEGWEDGCLTGTNTYSLLYAPMLDKPFVKDIEVIARQGEPKDSVAKDNYKSGWNEGFTLCRFYQASVYELMQFVILIATLLFIGYLMARRK